MYELKQVGPQSYYINSPAKIGIYRQSENEVYLIDSGNGREEGIEDCRTERMAYQRHHQHP